MASVLLLPSPPPELVLPKDSNRTISGPVDKRIEPLGRYFAVHVSRRTHGRTISEDERTRLIAEAQEEELRRAAAKEEEEEEEDPSLLSLDAQQWKSQDHYKVLGLSRLRYRATFEDIKKAYNKKALKHHPDKKGGDDRFFKCIQMAYNVLSDPVKKRQFDSVDPGIPDEFPSAKEKGDFFTLYGPYFEREARFSNRQPVPRLGTYESPKQDVEEFYDFWYNFDSWRSFEYLDKHDTDLADNRDDKRYMDKKNRAERAQRKKEDNARLRKFVDQALKLDPRIAKFRREESKQRNAKREAREAAERQAALAKQKVEENAKAAAERAALEAKAEAEAAKKMKDKKKYALKKEKKTLKKLIAEHNYFLPAGAPVAGPDEIEQQLNKLDVAFSKLAVDELEELRIALEAAKGDHDAMSVRFEAAASK